MSNLSSLPLPSEYSAGKTLSLPSLAPRRIRVRVLTCLALGFAGLLSMSAWAQTAPRLVGWDTPAPGTQAAQGDVVASIQQPASLRTLHANTPSQPAQNGIHIRRSGQACWDEAARYHGLDPWLLYAVAYVESTHNPNVISKPNRNGTYDIGLMQINSVHLPRLQRYGITQSTLMDACASTYVGAWIMADNIRRYGWSWQAIAAYNVGSLNTPARAQIGRRYAGKVYEAYGKLSRQHPIAGVQASIR